MHVGCRGQVRNVDKVHRYQGVLGFCVESRWDSGLSVEGICLTLEQQARKTYGCRIFDRWSS